MVLKGNLRKGKNRMRGRGKMGVADVSWMSTTIFLFSHQDNLHSLIKGRICQVATQAERARHDVGWDATQINCIKRIFLWN